MSRPPAHATCREPRLAPQILLHRADAARHRFEQALDVLARIHQPLGAQHAVGVDERRVRQLADLVRQSRARATARRSAPSSPCARTKASCSARAPSLASTRRTRTRLRGAARRRGSPTSSCRPGRSARRRPATCSGAAHRAPPTISTSAPTNRPAAKRGAGAPIARPFAPDQRARRRDALVQHADLAHQCGDHGAKRQHHDPQHQVRDQQRLNHAPPRARSPARSLRHADAPAPRCAVHWRAVPRPPHRAAPAALAPATIVTASIQVSARAAAGSALASASAARMRLRSDQRAASGCRAHRASAAAVEVAAAAHAG